MLITRGFLVDPMKLTALFLLFVGTIFGLPIMLDSVEKEKAPLNELDSELLKVTKQKRDYEEELDSLEKELEKHPELTMKSIYPDENELF